MKLQNLSVIFVLIVLPLILVLSYYISLQSDTINLQSAYNSKLADSTKEAIDAFEINTVEWNANYSETADSKRRDVMASINTFITSFSNNIGIGGTSRENILSYMPAIVYTLYDGYYIYSPSDVKPVIKNDNGVAVTINKDLCEKSIITGYTYNESDYGKLLYKPRAGISPSGYYNGQAFTLNPDNAADAEYKHILKPFAPYSENIEGTKLVINYTLDNYITIYGELEDEDEDGTNDKYVFKTGYLTNIGKIGGITPNKIEGIQFNGNAVEPEILEEQIAYEDNAGNMHVDSFVYVYEAEQNIKIYYDDSADKFFRLDNNKIVWIDELSKPVYKKCTVPRKNDGEWTYIELYQNLIDGNWYTTEDKEVYSLRYSADELDKLPEGINPNRIYDYSAINYCVESYIFTNWYNQIIENEIGGTDNKYYISSTNDPEVEESAFSLQRRAVIKERVNSDLQQSIASYSRNTPNEYRIPELKEEDWNQVLKNASIITFIQNIPIGMKYYNDYAIATSTINKEYVDPNEIYLNASNGSYYHIPYCTHLGEDHLIGYRSVDYIQKSYDTVDATNKPITKYYYRHADNTNTHINVEEACYSCLIQRSEYEEIETPSKQKAYYTALAREKYVARNTKLPSEIDPAYYIKVTTSGTSSGKVYIKNMRDGNIVDGDGSKTKKILKEDETNTFHIYGEKSNILEEVSGEDIIEINNDELNLDSAQNVITSSISTRSYYTSDEEIKINIVNYNEDGLTISYSEISDPAPDYGAGESDDFSGETYISSELGTGYVNVKLKYNSNYLLGAGAGLNVWANINSHNELVIVTEAKEITGQVRLRFSPKSGDDPLYYSANTFNIKEGVENPKLCCKIQDDTNWYNNEWHVDVLNTANEVIAGGDVSYYTINDAEGLKGFSTAMNEGAKSANRKFYLINNINLEGTSNYFTACHTNPFNGEFYGTSPEGTQYEISNLHIYPNSSQKDPENWGLFGKNNGIIENVILVNPTVQINEIKTTNNKVYRIGTIAGFNEGTIKNVEISGGTIRGTAYTGGISGDNEGTIENAVVNSNTTIKTLGRVHTIIANNSLEDNSLYIGGIAGNSAGKIISCSVLNSEVGTKSEGFGYKVTVNKKNNDKKQYINLDNLVFIGGIAGKFSGSEFSVKDGNIEGLTIGNTEIECNLVSEILADPNMILVDRSLNKGCYIGGVVGYLNSDVTLNGITVKGGTINGTNLKVDHVEDKKNLSISYSLQDIIFDTFNINAFRNCTGGIVGYLTGNANIFKCVNETQINGQSNVGGIVGITDTGYIKDCANKAQLRGKNKGTGTGGFVKSDEEAFTGTHVYVDTCSGTGGIVGFNRNATIQSSYNTGEINCNYNGGGITGLDFFGTIKYCFNSKLITNNNGNKEESRDNLLINNRLGGIVGVAENTNIYYCYNKGNITGWEAASTAHNVAVGGIAGVTFNYRPDDIEVGNIQYCYNVGEIKGHYTEAVSNRWHNGGIIGYKGTGRITLVGNKYITGRSKGFGLGASLDVSESLNNDNYKGYSPQEMKEQLYKWSISESGSPAYVSTADATSGTFAYNTIGPVETDKGYEGYGVLWWELEGYSKQTFYIYDSQGPAIYDPTLNINGNTVELPLGGHYYNMGGKDYHAYRVMLRVGNTYDCSATDSGGFYTDGETTTIAVTEEEKIIPVYIGTRGNFVLAVENNTADSTINGYTYIPQGTYYIIMTGGGRQWT